MRTVLDLLISLHRMETAVNNALKLHQFTVREQITAKRHLDLLREVIPPVVLEQWDTLRNRKESYPESPEMHAMAVILAAYGALPARKRKTLLEHFGRVPRARCRQAELPGRCAEPRVINFNQTADHDEIVSVD